MLAQHQETKAVRKAFLQHQFMKQRGVFKTCIYFTFLDF